MRTIIELLRDKIRDEENLLQDYHKGRVEAFRYIRELLEDDKDGTMYMNIETGSVDNFAGWWYEGENGQIVNAVALGEVVEVVKDDDGQWVEIKERQDEN